MVLAPSIITDVQRKWNKAQQPGQDHDYLYDDKAQSEDDEQASSIEEDQDENELKLKKPKPNWAVGTSYYGEGSALPGSVDDEPFQWNDDQLDLLLDIGNADEQVHFTAEEVLPAAGSPMVKTTMTVGLRKKTHVFYAIPDTGSERTILSDSYLEQVVGPRMAANMIRPIQNVPKLKSASGHPLKILGCIPCDLGLGTFRKRHPVIVCAGSGPTFLLGNDFLRDDVIIDKTRFLKFEDSNHQPVRIQYRKEKFIGSVLEDTLVAPNSSKIFRIVLSSQLDQDEQEGFFKRRDVLAMGNPGIMTDARTPFQSMDMVTTTNDKGECLFGIFNRSNEILTIKQGLQIASCYFLAQDAEDCLYVDQEAHGFEEEDLDGWNNFQRDFMGQPKFPTNFEPAPQYKQKEKASDESHGTAEEKAHFIHDNEERKRILEDTQGILPEPYGIELEEAKPGEWWQHVPVDHLPRHQRRKLLAVLRKYPEAFAKTEDEVGRFKYFSVKLPLKEGYKVQTDKYRAIPDKDSAELQKLIDKLLRQGVVRPSQSQWASNLVLVKRKIGDKIKYRMCFDARRVNQEIVPISWPNQSLIECYNRIAQAHYRTFVDLKQAFHSIPLDPSSRPVTAFIGPGPRLYEHVMLPFGLNMSLSAFLICLDMVTARSPYLQHFADDVAVLTPKLAPDASDDDCFDFHLTQVELLLRRLEHAGLKLEPSKCQFCLRPEQTVSYLGHEMSAFYYKPEAAKIKTLMEFPEPKTVKQAMRLQGMISFYRHFLKDCAKRMSPFTDDIKIANQTGTFKLSKAGRDAIYEVTSELCKPPILRIVQTTLPFLIYADASKTACGLCLHQFEKEPDDSYPIAYASRKFTVPEQKLPPSAQEILAIVYGLTLWASMIQGQRVIIRTDCRCWTYLQLTSTSSSRMSRIGLFISELNPLIQYYPGTKNKAADAISRAYDNCASKVDNPRLLKDPDIANVDVPDALKTNDIVPFCDFMDKCERALENEWPMEKRNEIGKRHTKAKNVAKQMAMALIHEHSLNVFHSPEANALTKVDIDDRSLICEVGSERELELSNDVPARVALISTRAACFSLQGFAKLQHDSKELKSLIRELKEKPVNYRKQGYFLKRGLLMHEYQDANGETHMSVVVPEILVENILRAYHSSINGIHLGSKVMEATLKRNFHWKSMTKDVKRYCSRCIQCIYNKKYPIAYRMGRLLIPKGPLHCVYIDVMGGLPRSYDGCTSCLCIIDGFSKHCSAIPLRSEKAEYVAKVFMQQYCLPVGSPLLLASDNALNMAGEVMQWMMALMGTRKTQVPSYRPQSDICETFVGKLGDLLRTRLMDKDQRNWTIVLPFLLIALNSSVSPTTLCTPNELFYGRAYEHVQTPLIPPDEPELSKYELLQSIRRAQEYKYLIIQARAKKLQDERNEKANENTLEHPFTPGAFVMVKDKHPKGRGEAKLAPKWEGPFLVIMATESVLMVIPYMEAERYQDYDLDPELFKTKQQGSPKPRTFYYRVVPVTGVKPFRGEVSVPPDFDPELVDNFLNTLGKKWDTQSTIMFENLDNDKDDAFNVPRPSVRSRYESEQLERRYNLRKRKARSKSSSSDDSSPPPTNRAPSTPQQVNISTPSQTPPPSLPSQPSDEETSADDEMDEEDADAGDAQPDLVIESDEEDGNDMGPDVEDVQSQQRSEEEDDDGGADDDATPQQHQATGAASFSRGQGRVATPIVYPQDEDLTPEERALVPQNVSTPSFDPDYRPRGSQRQQLDLQQDQQPRQIPFQHQQSGPVQRSPVVSRPVQPQDERDQPQVQQSMPGSSAKEMFKPKTEVKTEVRAGPITRSRSGAESRSPQPSMSKSGPVQRTPVQSKAASGSHDKEPAGSDGSADSSQPTGAMKPVVQMPRLTKTRMEELLDVIKEEEDVVRSDLKRIFYNKKEKEERRIQLIQLKQDVNDPALDPFEKVIAKRAIDNQLLDIEGKSPTDKSLRPSKDELKKTKRVLEARLASWGDNEEMPEKRSRKKTQLFQFSSK